MVMESARQALSDLEMIPSNARVLVAVSGGIDSIVLLDILVNLSSEGSFELIVGTIDHGLRGEDSTRDAAFVREVADSYGLRFVEVCLTHDDIERHKSHGRHRSRWRNRQSWRSGRPGASLLRNNPGRPGSGRGLS